jgi:hypothetical protein
MSEKVLLLKGDVDPDELISSFVFAETFPILQVTMTRLPAELVGKWFVQQKFQILF